MVQTRKSTPQAQHLTDGHWIVVYERPLTFTLKCPYTIPSGSLITKSPIDILTLNEGCSASNEYMTLPPFHHFESRYNLTDPFHELIANYYVGSIKLWDPFTQKFPNVKDIKIPTKLKPIKEIPIDNLISELDNSPKLVPMEPKMSLETYLSIIGLVICFLLIVVSCRKRIRNKCQKYRISQCCKWSDEKGNIELSSSPAMPEKEPEILQRHPPRRPQTSTGQRKQHRHSTSDLDNQHPDESSIDRRLADLWLRELSTFQQNHPGPFASVTDESEDDEIVEAVNASPIIPSEGPTVTKELTKCNPPRRPNPNKSVIQDLYPSLRKELIEGP